MQEHLRLLKQLNLQVANIIVNMVVMAVAKEDAVLPAPHHVVAVAKDHVTEVALVHAQVVA